MGQRTPRDDGLHVAIIMDGNGRWARRRHRPRRFGHREGARAVRAVVEAAADPSSGIGMLTLYAFSSDNWRRPREEVRGVMALFRQYLRSETARCVENGVRLRVLGRRDRLARELVREIELAESATAACSRLELRLAVDYSAREMIVRAAERLGEASESSADRESFAAALGAVGGDAAPARDVDLLVRTGGEQRLSDFLLWECAYAELVFTPKLWPDFGGQDLRAAVAEFRGRERRFGGLLEAAV